MLAKKTSGHLRKLMEESEAVRKQFEYSDNEQDFTEAQEVNPFEETSYEPTKGLVHKYPNRVLILLTQVCAAYCRFCTRRRMVSDMEKEKVNQSDVDKMADYIVSQPEINEVIFSGGDPLTSPKNLVYAMQKFAEMEQIKIIRIHTRVPIVAPKLFDAKIIQSIQKISETKPVYISLHTNHPDELRDETKKLIHKLRRAGAILISQSVFLKGINDSVEVLAKLFTRLTELGVKPYYIHRCDLVKGVEHWIIPIEKEVEIMTELRKKISGLAYPIHAIDVPGGSGKVPVPTNFWQHNLDNFTDFNDKKISMYGPRIKK